MPWSFVILLVVFSPIVALAPVRWAIRLWITTALIFATTATLQGEVQFEDQGILPERLILGSLTLLLSFSGIAIALRRMSSSSPSSAISKVENVALRWLDLLIAAIGGLCGGMFLTLALAVALRGFPGGLTLHVAVAIISAVGCIASVRYLEGIVRTAVVPTLALTTGLTLLGGVWYPQLIASRAADVNPNLPRCLRAVDVPADLDETRLLTLPLGQPGGPGLILTIMTPQGAQHFRWSYRLLAFTPYGAYRHGGCPA